MNLLVQKHFPEVLPALAKVVSPMQAHCRDLKRRHPGCRTVFIGPCISKKDEAESYPGIVDCVLTFEELSAWLDQSGVTLEQGTDGNQESRARLFPTTGGILRTMAERNPDYAYLAVDGIDNCITALRDIAEGRMGKCFIEMSACPAAASAVRPWARTAGLRCGTLSLWTGMPAPPTSPSSPCRRRR